MTALDNLFGVLVKRVGRKGAVFCMGALGLLLAFLLVVCLQAWRGQTIEGAWNTFCAAWAGLLLTFVGGNAAEHFAKRGPGGPAKPDGGAQ